MKSYVRARIILVNDWNQAYKWASVRAAALETALLGTQAWLHDSVGQVAAITQSKYFTIATAVLGAAIIGLRLIKVNPPAQDQGT